MRGLIILSIFFFLALTFFGMGGLLTGVLAITVFSVVPPVLISLRRQASVLYPWQISPLEKYGLRLSLIINRVFFPDNAFTLGVPLVRFSLIERSRHNLRKADDYIRQAVALSERCLKNPKLKQVDVSNILTLAAELAKTGRFEECLEVVRRTAQQSQHLKGKMALKSRLQLMLIGGYASWSNSELESCRDFCRQAVALSAESGKACRFECFSATLYLISLALEQADYARAGKQLAEVKEQAEQLTGRKHEYALSLLGIYTATIAQHQGDYAGVESTLRQVYGKYAPSRPRIIAESDRMRANSAILLSILYASCARVQEAEEYCRQAREIAEIPAELLFKVTLSNDIGYCLLLMHRLEEAEQFLHLSEEILRDYLPVRHYLRATLLNNAADIAVELGQTERAAQLLEECATIRRQNLPEEHPHNIRIHLTSARILLAGNKAEQALSECKYVLRLRENMYPENHLEIAFALEVYARVLRTLEREGEALQAESRREKIILKVREQLSQPLVVS